MAYGTMAIWSWMNWGTKKNDWAIIIPTAIRFFNAENAEYKDTEGRGEEEIDWK